MQPEPTQGSSTLKVIAAVLLVGLGLAGLAMSLCGGFFAGFSGYLALSGQTAGETGQWAGLFAVTGSVSLVVGLLVIFLSVVAWRRVTAPRPDGPNA